MTYPERSPRPWEERLREATPAGAPLHLRGQERCHEALTPQDALTSSLCFSFQEPAEQSGKHTHPKEWHPPIKGTASSIVQIDWKRGTTIACVSAALRRWARGWWQGCLQPSTPLAWLALTTRQPLKSERSLTVSFRVKVTPLRWLLPAKGLTGFEAQLQVDQVKCMIFPKLTSLLPWEDLWLVPTPGSLSSWVNVKSTMGVLFRYPWRKVRESGWEMLRPSGFHEEEDVQTHTHNGMAGPSEFAGWSACHPELT